MYVEKSFPPTAEAPRAVRVWIRALLRAESHAPLEHTACLLVTELVTNAVLHARTPIRVALELTGSGLRMSVEDRNPHTPTVRPLETEATTGRGLHLVELLADRWGLEDRPDGKAVWCALVTSTDADDEAYAQPDERPQRSEQRG